MMRTLPVSLTLLALSTIGCGGGKTAPQTPQGYQVVKKGVVNLGHQEVGDASVRCPAGTFVVGGGMITNEVELHVADSFPVPDGSGWKGKVKSNWNPLLPSASSVQVVVVCTAPLAGYEIVVTPSVIISPGNKLTDTASCPTGKVVLGGGVQSSNEYLNLVASAPKADSTGWTVTGFAAGTGTTSIRTTAICSSPVAGHQIVTGSAVSANAGQFGTFQINCPGGTRAFGGGFVSSDSAAQVFKLDTATPSGGGWTGLFGNYNSIIGGTTVSTTPTAICAPVA